MVIVRGVLSTERMAGSVQWSCSHKLSQYSVLIRAER